MKTSNNDSAKFQTGELIATQRVSGDMFATPQFSIFCQHSLERHRNGDWGDIPEEDKESNENALNDGDRIFSGYLLPDELKETANGSKIWIITEHDRSVTTILYPHEY